MANNGRTSGKSLIITGHVAGPNPYVPGAGNRPTITLPELRRIAALEDITLLCTGIYKAIPMVIAGNIVEFMLTEPAVMATHTHGHVVLPDTVTANRVLHYQVVASSAVVAHDSDLAAGGVGGAACNIPANATHVILDVRYHDAAPGAALGATIGEGVTGNYAQVSNGSVAGIFGERTAIVPIGAGDTINIAVAASGVGTANCDIYIIGFFVATPISAGTETHQEVPGGDISGEIIYAIVRGRQDRVDR